MLDDIGKDPFYACNMLDKTQATYTVAEVARLIRVSEETVRRMARKGLLKPIPNLRVKRFTSATVQRLFDE